MNKREAQAQGLNFYCTGKPCKRGHMSDRYAKTGICVECAKSRAVVWRINNIEKYNLNQKTWKSKNRLKVNEDMRLWAHKNPHKIQARDKIYRLHNRDKVNELASYNKLKRAKRVPAWLSEEDRQSIKKIYALAKELSAAYGFPWEVDHVIPLRGKTVSGLHVPSNLQIMPRSENRRKRNHYTERGL